MEVTEEKVNNTISLDWKQKTKTIAIRLGDEQQNHPIINNHNNKKHEDKAGRRFSTRTKKPPVHRYSDFFYGKKRFRIW
jgi:hypothetical protein